MLSAANNLEFEKAALIRDQINELKRRFGGAAGGDAGTAQPPELAGKGRGAGRSSRKGRSPTRL
jgi:hypothetical protein